MQERAVGNVSGGAVGSLSFEVMAKGTVWRRRSSSSEICSHLFGNISEATGICRTNYRGVSCAELPAGCALRCAQSGETRPFGPRTDAP